MLTVGTLSSPLSLSTGVFVFNKDALMKESMFVLPSFSEDKYVSLSFWSTKKVMCVYIFAVCKYH